MDIADIIFMSFTTTAVLAVLGYSTWLARGLPRKFDWKPCGPIIIIIFLLGAIMAVLAAFQGEWIVAIHVVVMALSMIVIIAQHAMHLKYLK